MVETDRRVRRTRRTLTEAFVALVLEQGYERLTVQDILDRADVGRSTFYAHFRDKESLLRPASRVSARTWPRRSRRAGPTRRRAGRHRVPPRLRAPEVGKVLCGHRGGTVVQRHLSRLLGGIVAITSGTVVAERRPTARDRGGVLRQRDPRRLLAWWVDHDFAYGPDQWPRCTTG